MRRSTVVAIAAAPLAIYGAMKVRRLAARMRLVSTYPGGSGLKLVLEPDDVP